MRLLLVIGIVAVTDAARELLPNPTNCGYQNSLQESNSVSLHEFPWIVHVKSSNLDQQYEFADRCSGVLISDRYVLTDAYCGASAIKVVLGQYQTNEDVACRESVCTESKHEIKVEENVRNGKKENGPYDFSLLRLLEKVAFSDFIKPICIKPSENDHKNLTVSGWGAANSSDVTKKRMHYRLVSHQVCYSEEEYLKNNVEFANVSFLCALPYEKNDQSACNGDHGGPFMYKSDSGQWFAEGVVVQVMYLDDETNHFNTCSREKPINGIRITRSVIDWIVSSIRP